MPRHATWGDPDDDDRFFPAEEPQPFQAAADYLASWYPYDTRRARPLLSALAFDRIVRPGLLDELTHELLHCPPEHERAGELVTMARMIVDHLADHGGPA